MGLFEYLQLCEDLSAEPLYVGFAGQTCIFRQREHVPMEEMPWVRDNFLDLIEYADGPAESQWGRVRAVAGHAAPFGLKYVEIGNENQGREFAERYRFIYDAMKARYPKLTYFADLSWTSHDAMGDAKYDVEDSHHYNSPRWFLSRFNEYDQRDRKLPPLYLGELAVTSREAGPLRGDLLAALSEGVFLMGCERNADAVRMVSYAPLLAHLEGRTELTGSPPPWHGMIYFDGTHVFGTASYYLWKLFSQNRPSFTIKTEVTFPDAKPAIVAGQIGVGTWDATADFKDVRVERDSRLLYESDFSEQAGGWKNTGGQWSVTNAAYHQTRRGQGLSYFGDENWSDYTLTLKARKLSGSEGFLILFGRKGADKYWWNLGGWGNTQHAIEFNQTPVGRPVRGRIENDRWYDVKVSLSGSRIRCYLDGELLHDATAASSQKFFAVAGRDNDTGDVILKAINVAEDKVSASLKLMGLGAGPGGANLFVLQAESLSDNNSLEEPVRVTPKELRLENTGVEFPHEFPPRSLSILRWKAR
jgi:alpha-L-arabinofuranosidase